MNPYSPPQASLSQPEERPTPRPFLAWLTLLLAAALMVLEPIPTIRSFENLSHGLPGQSFNFLLFVACTNASLTALAGALLYGLIRVTRWAWHTSLLLACCLLAITIFVVWNTIIHPATEDSRTAYQFGLWLGRVIVLTPPTAYLIGLYRSPKLRAYLGV
jgi:hypothetical protein